MKSLLKFILFLPVFGGFLANSSAQAMLGRQAVKAGSNLAKLSLQRPPLGALSASRLSPVFYQGSASI